MPSRSELVAYGRKEEDVAEAIGADLVIFQTLPDLIESVRHLNPSIKRFDCSLFDGDYVTGGVDEAYFSKLETLRADNVRGKAAMMSGDLGPAEGKGGGGAPPMNGITEDVVSIGTMNGDDTVGLHNTWKR